MTTTHRLRLGDARDLVATLPEASVHLVVTSPPYPMVEMWDEGFEAASPDVARALRRGDGWAAFEAMHAVLDEVWAACAHVLVPGGFLCVNVGDAVRTVDGTFRMYPNHARITTALLPLGLSPLPDILWRKPTNAPNKFMGSGMLPAGAYVTYEHEYVLVFRKGGKRTFSDDEKARRAESAYFWEERNVWFSDLWSDLRGTRQKSGAETRARSGAYPFNLPWRLVQMYSILGDTVLDPFVGTGTTQAAALAGARHSIGFEDDAGIAALVPEALRQAVVGSPAGLAERWERHRAFVQQREEAGKLIAHRARAYDVPVVTRQEAGIRWYEAVEIQQDDISAQGGTVTVRHRPFDPSRPSTAAPPSRARRTTPQLALL